ncbi:MAG: hypothetical protein E7004_04430 [Alphaproteobacteria bacterium]|nr:hypothetical protein [Alphaproteobacteria bacterium]
MGKEVNVSIVLPARTYLQETVASVIVPAIRADIDILPDRAPSIFALDFGLVKLFNQNGTLKDSYFIQPGMAEVANNECKIMTQGVISAKEVSVYDAKKKLAEAESEQMKLFYQMVLDYQRGTRRRYLRTLQLYNKKLKSKKNVLKNFIFRPFTKKSDDKINH